jgi:phospholipase C
LHGNESNRVEGRTLPVRMHRAREIVPNPITQIPLSPRHDFKPVERQINDGAMSGFGQDFEDRHPGFAELVMTFYTADELKVYDRLAADYCVCDHWYCAHAGPTFPNRFVTLSGSTPALDNFAVDDPILGFLPERTIFDVLRERGITWAVFESDLSIIRMFNHFRLNANEVRPYINREDPGQSFAEVAKRGELPQVVFVEPNFVDIPPIETATDDHPPADLRRGQNFVAEVVRALTANREHWQRTMLAITYDEHGGFFDHIPPPGTSLGNPDFIGKIPRVHPDGQDFMGPRVPSFVISPFVSAGAVCKDVLDHTSIIKTILLRHREKIPTEVFTQFGPRVDMIAHLGVTLDLDQPRPDAPPRLERMRIAREPADPAARADFLARLGPPEPDDFHESLRRAVLPKRT